MRKMLNSNSSNSKLFIQLSFQLSPPRLLQRQRQIRLQAHARQRKHGHMGPYRHFSFRRLLGGSATELRISTGLSGRSVHDDGLQLWHKCMRCLPSRYVARCYFNFLYLCKLFAANSKVYPLSFDQMQNGWFSCKCESIELLTVKSPADRLAHSSHFPSFFLSTFLCV